MTMIVTMPMFAIMVVIMIIMIIKLIMIIVSIIDIGLIMVEVMFLGGKEIQQNHQSFGTILEVVAIFPGYGNRDGGKLNIIISKQN